MGAGCVCRRRCRGTAVPDAIVACVQLPPRSFTPSGLGAPRDCCVVAALAGEQTVLRRGLRRHPRQPPATPATNTVSRLPRTRKCICKHASMPLLLVGVDYEYKAVNLLKDEQSDPG
ncbi:uncharacterized protein [Miscanthus floridulus]|uniref:uncharacterized protein n=1 Tax=Miscanthus floridulus TaxID=154761 RepID=UPI0034578789